MDKNRGDVVARQPNTDLRRAAAVAAHTHTKRYPDYCRKARRDYHQAYQTFTQCTYRPKSTGNPPGSHTGNGALHNGGLSLYVKFETGNQMRGSLVMAISDLVTIVRPPVSSPLTCPNWTIALSPVSLASGIL
ncbi:hypothetical protein PoB_001590500 [Plakobranchus ocellatus]|uniref:Uncharacterized protein n=1 Tax=Plakobranchus ocellatus TaxID=259542 RepID=A0AAV3Z2L9_9GAST|nr:hypothetical protein PoB_001590500 [Plakobranchus ocellatus]